jgi:hypothetical protein
MDMKMLLLALALATNPMPIALENGEVATYCGRVEFLPFDRMFICYEAPLFKDGFE